MKDEYKELSHFIRVYFGDPRRGQAKEGIVAEAVSEEPDADYLEEINKQLDQFTNSSIPLDQKHKLLLSWRIYTESGEEAI
mgnify:CR=1 FL=1